MRPRWGVLGLFQTMKQTAFIKSPLVLAAIVALVLSAGLTGYGLVADHSAKHDLQVLAQKMKAQTASQLSADTTADKTTTTKTPSSSSTNSSDFSKTKAGTPTATSSKPPVALTAADRTTATTNVVDLDTFLEAYFATFGYYPGSIAPSEFSALASNSNYSGDDPVAQAQVDTSGPSGVSYVYTPIPKGCTTANNTCAHFTLTSQAGDGSIIKSEQSYN
jgi:hypothetical protein